jgi:hypothetical protein
MVVSLKEKMVVSRMLFLLWVCSEPCPYRAASEIWRRWATRQESQCIQSICVQLMTCAGIFTQSMGAKNRVGIWLSYRFARLRRLAELIPWNWFLGSLKSLKIRALTRRKENSPDVEEGKAGFSALSGCSKSNLVASGKGKRVCILCTYRTCCWRIRAGSLQLRIPNSTWRFKLGRQETGATEVQVSSLDLGWAVLLFTLSPGRIAYW